MFFGNENLQVYKVYHKWEAGANPEFGVHVDFVPFFFNDPHEG